MKGLTFLVGLLFFGASAGAAEPPVVRIEGVTFGMTIQQAYDVLATRLMVARKKDPFGLGREVLEFPVATLDNMAFTVSVSEKGRMNFEGARSYGKASEVTCDDKLRDIRKYLDLPKELRRHVVTHRVEGGAVWKRTFNCLGDSATVMYGADFDAVDKLCNVRVNINDMQHCEAALAAFLEANAIPPGDVRVE